MKRFLPWWRMHGYVLSGLCLLTVILWQWRFVRTGPNLLADDACQSLAHWIGGERINPAYAKADREGIVLTKKVSQPSFSLSQNLDRIENVRYLAVTMEAAWENARASSRVLWFKPRVVIAGYDAKGNFCAPLDHGVLNAQGTRDWHTVQAVVELPPDLKMARVSMDGFGEEGVLRLRNMRVEAVKQRAWFVPATALLLGFWAWALGRILRPAIRGRQPMLRSTAIACGILLGFWFFVFPQGRTLFPTLMGKFAMGPTIAKVVESVTVLETAQPAQPVVKVEPPKVQPEAVPRAPRLRTIVPPGSPELKPLKPQPVVRDVQVVPIPVVTTTEPESRLSASFFGWLRDIDRHWNVEKYNLTHFSAFFGIGLFVFCLAGTWRIWPLPFTVAVLGEIIPNALFDTWDRGDWWDVFANFSGLTVALSIVMLIQRIRRKRREKDLVAQ